MKESKINGYRYREISINDKEYPKKLKEIKNPPETLYVLGNLPDENKKSVAIVGARNCTDYGSTLSKSLSRSFSKNDIQVISGLAMGCDTQAHIGAIEVEKPTFAVMGCGVDICFPTYNQDVYKKILEYGGGIISEQPLKTSPMPYNFPLRNRIISALSDSVVLVESRENSSSLITCDFALEQGKSIFACPSRVGDNLGKGCNNLIKQGAYILTSPEDVMEHLNVKNYEADKKIDLSQFDYFEKLIIDTIKDDTLHVDQIVEKTKLPINKVLNTLMSLELMGFVESNINNHYRLTNPYMSDAQLNVNDMKDDIIKNDFINTLNNGNDYYNEIGTRSK